MSDIAQHIAVSKKVDYDDLDWAAAKRHGLTAQEVECLSYFADIESQTIFYFLEVAKLEVARNPDFLTFLTMWNYEEYFHSHAITRLLEESGVDVQAAASRAAEVRGAARWKAKFEDVVQTGLASIAPKSFIALWMTWGSTQELMTTQAYEEIVTRTANPVCAELCRRIAKQERRHFAYYYGNARDCLSESRTTQRLVRAIMERLWTPVGNGVKTPAEAAQLAARLWPGERFGEVLGVVDKRIGALPGMEGFHACRTWGKKFQIQAASEAAINARADQYRGDMN